MTEPSGTPSQPRASPGDAQVAGLAVLFFASGAAALVLQVVWVYRLGLVFGNAAYATAATLSAFFLGVALGGWVGGRVAQRLPRPLVAYASMEWGIALGALLFLPGVAAYEAAYPSIGGLAGDTRGLLTLVKLAFSVSLLLIPTVLMGGTFPVLVQYVTQTRIQLARRGTLLYAANTLGAAFGAALAAFVLLPRLGVRHTYLAALFAIVAVGVAAFMLASVAGRGETSSGRPTSEPDPQAARVDPGAEDSTPVTVPLVPLAIASGLLTLSAEVLWTRMLAQVLQNSVYSFAAVLVVFLLALGLGASLAHVLSRLRTAPERVLAWLLGLAAVSVALSPFFFGQLTDGLTYLAPRSSWGGYVAQVFLLSATVVLPPTLLMGAVFPYLLKVTPADRRGAGAAVGRLVLLNSLGAAAGPLVVGFLALDLLGLWRSVELVAAGYGLLALTIAFHPSAGPLYRWRVPLALGVLGALAWPEPAAVRLEPGERLVESWHSSDGVVSVVQAGGHLQMRLNNSYALGDTRSALAEQMQAHIPLLLQQDPERVLFLGMGTGISAGAALDHPVKEVVAAEIVPDVVEAARRYFAPWTNGLFEDARVRIVAEDARNHLLGTKARYDVIVGDLFTPWHAGTGGLYTLEQFRLVRSRLAPGGLFAQWLPLHQLTEEDLRTIASTFSHVFPTATVWRADFSSERASVALVGQEAGAILDQATLRRNSRVLFSGSAAPSSEAEPHMAALFYVGNLEGMRADLGTLAPNTDDRRTIEYQVPLSAHRALARGRGFLTGAELHRFIDTLALRLPPERDPYLSDLPPGETNFAEVGRLYARYLFAGGSGRNGEASRILGDILDTAPAFGRMIAPGPPDGRP